MVPRFSIPAPARACSPSRRPAPCGGPCSQPTSTAAPCARPAPMPRSIAPAVSSRWKSRRCHRTKTPRTCPLRFHPRQYPAAAAATPRRAAHTAHRARCACRVIRPAASQANAAIAAYRGLALERRIDLDGWTTPGLVRRQRPGASVAGIAASTDRLPSCSRSTSSCSRIAASAPKARRAWRRCGRSWPNAALMVSSCRAPTASRTNMCRPAPSSWPGSPASPARPASPSCSPTAP